MAVAKRALKAGEMLDGEGGYTRLCQTHSGGAKPCKLGALPIGLAHHVKAVRNVAAGEIVTAADVALDGTMQAVRIRREMESGRRGRHQNNGTVIEHDPEKWNWFPGFAKPASAGEASQLSTNIIRRARRRGSIRARRPLSPEMVVRTM